MRSFYLGILIFITINGEFSYANLTCKSLLAKRPYFKLILDSKVNMDHLTNSVVRYLVIGATGKTVGSFIVFLENGHYDFQMHLNDAYKGHGISKLFFSAFFKRFKTMRPIHSFLVHDNLDSFLNSKEQGLGPEAAANKTPFVRALRHFGYRIQNIDFRDDSTPYVYLTLIHQIEE